MARLPRLLALLTAGALVVSGCGRDDGAAVRDETTPTPDRGTASDQAGDAKAVPDLATLPRRLGLA